MKLLVINGPNINMLGIREPSVYGNDTYEDLKKKILAYAESIGAETELFQSNSEGAIVDKIQQAYNVFDAIIINPAAYTHTSVAILDALKAVALPTAEVHISNIDEREEFRRFSYVSLYAEKTICGKGFDGYIEAMDYLVNKKRKKA